MAVFNTELRLKHIFSLSSIGLFFEFLLAHSICEGEYVKTQTG